MALPDPTYGSRFARGRLPRLLREKTSEKVYPKTLIITALTAATVAIISSRLIGLLDSFLVVGVASILTAFVSEFYRVTLETTHRAIARAVARSLDNRLGELTGEVPVIDASIEEELVEEALGSHEVDPDPRKPVLWLFFHRIFVSRWAVPLVFTLVALATVSGSYVVGKINSAPSYNVVNEVTNTRDISDRKVNALEESAIAVAEEEADEASDEASALVNATRLELLDRITSLEAQLAAAQANGAKDDKTIAALAEQTLELQTQLTELLKQLEQLQSQVDDLSSNTPADPPTETPTEEPPAEDPTTEETPSTTETDPVFPGQ